jgi:hypothetical protein
VRAVAMPCEAIARALGSDVSCAPATGRPEPIHVAQMHETMSKAPVSTGVVPIFTRAPALARCALHGEVATN